MDHNPIEPTSYVLVPAVSYSVMTADFQFRDAPDYMSSIPLFRLVHAAGPAQKIMVEHG